MLKVIKMDLYRMFKSKYTYIVLAAAMLMMFASVFMTQQDISYYQQTPSAMETLRETGDEVNWGIYIGQVSPEWCTGAKIPVARACFYEYSKQITSDVFGGIYCAFCGQRNPNRIYQEYRRTDQTSLGVCNWETSFDCNFYCCTVGCGNSGNHGRKCSLFWICSYSGGRKIHRVFRDAISTSYCLWQRDPVPCLPISKCGSKPVDRDFAGGRNFTGCGCVADKHYSPSKRDCRL